MAPRREQMPEIGSIDFTVAIDVSTWQGGVHRSPEREQRAEVCTVYLAIDEQVCDALASVGDRIAVDVGRTGGEFARVAYAVVVAVGLQRIGDSGAVVNGVGAAVTIGVDGWRALECDGVESAPRDT